MSEQAQRSQIGSRRECTAVPQQRETALITSKASAELSVAVTKVP